MIKFIDKCFTICGRELVSVWLGEGAESETSHLQLSVGMGQGWGGAELHLGLQQLQKQFVHGHFAVLFDAVEVLHCLGGRLPEQW